MRTTKLVNSPVLFSTFFSLLSFLIHRYSFGIGDQSIHIPLIIKQIDPTLFPNDLMFSAGQSDLSSFYKLTTLVINHFHLTLETIFLIGFLTVTWILYLGIYHLGLILLKKNLNAVYFLATFFLVPFHIAGSATYSLEISFVPRMIAFVSSIWVFYFLFEHRFVLCLSLLIFIFAIHPISFLLIFVILLAVITSFRIKISNKTLIFSTLLLAVVSLPVITGYLRDSNNYVLSNSYWISILRERNTYAFLDLWGYKAWINLFLIILPSFYYGFYFKRSDKILKKFVKSILIICLSVTAIQFIFSTLLPLPFIIKLQLSRIWIFNYLTSAAAIASILLTIRFNFRYATSFIIFLLIILSSKYNNKWIYTQDNYWIDVQKWVNINIGKNCVLLTPFYHQGFRVYAYRTIVGEYKDGTLSFYSPYFAQEWQKRKIQIASWDSQDTDNILSLQPIYNFSYVVNLTDKKINLDSIYHNQKYTIYKMPTVEHNCKVN